MSVKLQGFAPLKKCKKMARNTKIEVTKHIYRGKAAVAAVILSLHLTHVTFDCGMKSSFAPAPI